MTFIDSHAHLTSKNVFPQIEGILSRAQQAGVSAIVNICTDRETLQNGLKLHESTPWVYNSASTTPHDVEKEGAEVFPLVVEQAKSGNLVAIGETGLDYHYTHSPVETQKTYLRKYLHLALECNLPVIIHCRDAFSDFFEILDQEYVVQGRHAPGVLHCFTGTVAEAEEVVARGWYLSLSGIVTFKKSLVLQEVAKRVPLENLLIETDTPYLAPQSRRGHPNEPAFLIETASCIAAFKQLTINEIANSTSNNAKALFKINAA